jgi:uncharacterized membrane protein required for colicin V production
MELIRNFPWIDIVVLTILLRLISISIRGEILSEFIKLAGVAVALFASLQYYPFLGDALKEMSFTDHREYFDTIFLILVFCIVNLIFLFLRRVILLNKKDRECSWWERGASLSLGLIRALPAIGLFVFVAYMFPPSREMTRTSFSFRALKDVAPGIYKGGFSLYKKINSGTSVNSEVEKYYDKKK